MAYPTTLALITALWSGPGAHEIDRPLVGHRRRHLRARAAARRGAARALLVGFRVPRHAAAGRGGARDGVASSSRAMSTRRPSPSTTSAASSPSSSSRRSSSRSTSPPFPTRERRARPRVDRDRGARGRFLIRQRRAPNPLYDLHVAARRVFWVAACAGLIVFGSLMGAMFIGQQFLQNVLGYSTLDAGLAILPAAVVHGAVAPRSAKLVEAHGARVHAADRLCLLPARVRDDAAALERGLALLAGRSRLRARRHRCRLRRDAGLALADRFGARERAGMASGTADLQRDLGGAIMQSILGALLTAGYAAAVATRDRRRANSRADHRQRRQPADEVLRRRRAVAAAVSAVREPDHRGREAVVPRRPGLGLRRGHRRDPARRHGRLLPLPEAARTRRGCSRGTSRGRRQRRTVHLIVAACSPSCVDGGIDVLPVEQSRAWALVFGVVLGTTLAGVVLGRRLQLTPTPCASRSASSRRRCSASSRSSWPSA